METAPAVDPNITLRFPFLPSPRFCYYSGGLRVEEGGVDMSPSGRVVHCSKLVDACAGCRRRVSSMPLIFSHAGAVAERGVNPDDAMCPSPHRLVLSGVRSCSRDRLRSAGVNDLVRGGHVGEGRSGLRPHVADRWRSTLYHHRRSASDGTARQCLGSPSH